MRRRRDFFHPLDLFEFALRLRGFACLRAESVRETLQRRDFSLLILVGREVLLGARAFLLLVTVPVAAIAMQTFGKSRRGRNGFCTDSRFVRAIFIVRCVR
jgi:hypothetical protein